MNPSLPSNSITPRSSVAGRAFLAIGLMVGFYILALGLVALLFYIPYAELAYLHRLHIKIAIVCVLGALAILWAILPRPDRFVPPGPRLTPEDNPRLFAELRDVAGAVGQAMPAEVYADPDINAWVAQRGGIMGLGSRRVMGVGLPLARILTVSQLRAVLAHEFGHYHGGDTKVGPWIYKTRSAIMRTVASFTDEKGEGSLLQLPFLWYGKMFLRITHAVSRRQEFVADEVAARTVGAKPLIDGLRAVHGCGPAYQAFWMGEVVPVLNAGFRPPLAEGFARFVQAKDISEGIAKQLQEEIQNEQADPYDTHPPLKERIAAVAHLPPGTSASADPPAISLFDDVPGLEERLLAAMTDAEKASKLKPLAWEEAGNQVFLPSWTRLVRANDKALYGLMPEALPRCAQDLKAFGDRFVRPDRGEVEDEDRPRLTSAAVGAALVLLLLRQGWTLEALPGAPVTVRRDGEQLEPFGVMGLLASGSLDAKTWQQRCAALGISGMNLGAVGAEPSTAPTT